MIYVSKSKIPQVEYLIYQSLQGNHVLFDTAVLRGVFGASQSNAPSVEESYQVEHHLEKLIELPTLEQKKEYLESLDELALSHVILTYFQIVENNLVSTLGAPH